MGYPSTKHNHTHTHTTMNSIRSIEFFSSIDGGRGNSIVYLQCRTLGSPSSWPYCSAHTTAAAAAAAADTFSWHCCDHKPHAGGSCGFGRRCTLRFHRGSTTRMRILQGSVPSCLDAHTHSFTHTHTHTSTEITTILLPYTRPRIRTHEQSSTLYTSRHHHRFVFVVVGIEETSHGTLSLWSS